MRPKINFITLAVENLEKSISFYKKAFGLEISDVNKSLCLFEMEDDFYLVLCQKEDFAKQVLGLNGSSGFILSNSVASKKEMEEVVTKAEKFGAKRVKELNEDWGHSITLQDLDGHHWEFVYTKPD